MRLRRTSSANWPRVTDPRTASTMATPYSHTGFTSPSPSPPPASMRASLMVSRGPVPPPPAASSCSPRRAPVFG